MAIPAMITAGHHTVAATTKNVCVRGMFLVTDVRLPQGVDVEVVLMLPKEIGIPESTMARCRGRILRTENNYGQLGVAAEINTIESYFAPNGIIRLASA